jgi:hypothetical protein
MGTAQQRNKESTAPCSAIPVSSLPKHRTRGHKKVSKIAKLAYRGAYRLVRESIKRHKLSLRGQLHQPSNGFSPTNGEQLLCELVNRYPKYSPIIQLIPLLFQLLPPELRESWRSELGTTWMGHILAVLR